MKAIRPMLDKVLAAYENIDRLSDDELREKCQSLKDLIQERIAADEARIAEIKAQLATEIPLSQKEKLATESDKVTWPKAELVDLIAACVDTAFEIAVASALIIAILSLSATVGIVSTKVAIFVGSPAKLTAWICNKFFDQPGKLI